MFRNRLTIIILMISLCSILGWLYRGRLMPAKPYLTIDEVWQDPEAWQDQQITLRGWIDFRVEFSSVACGSDFCACEGINKDLFLTSQDLRREIYLGELQCGGSACSDSCKPFNPKMVEAVELVGTLRVEKSAALSLCYWLPEAGANRPFQARLNRLVKRDLCTSQNQIVRTIWSPINQALTRPLYGLRLEDLELDASSRLTGDGDLDARTALPLTSKK